MWFEMEPVKWPLRSSCDAKHNVHSLIINFQQFLEIHNIWEVACIHFWCVCVSFHSGSGEYNESQREAGFSQRKQPSMHERVFSSCPYCTPLTFPHCWLSVQSQLIQQGNAFWITLTSLLQSCRCPRGAIMMVSSLRQRSKSAHLANCVWC